MTMPSIAIECSAVSKAFGRQAVLKGIDLAIEDGESIALTGENGAGKTTLLRCLAAAVRPTSGIVRWFGRPSWGDVEARRQIGLLNHQTGLYSQLTLRENLRFAVQMCGMDEPERRARRWLEMTGLRPYAQHLPGQVSRGMRQRIALGRALIHDPRLVFLDEPFTGLDAEGTQWLVRLLGDLHAGGRTLCFTVHEEEKLHRLADRLVELKSGRIHTGAASRGDRAPAPRAA